MNSIIKATSYTLFHAPDMVIHNGATQVTERLVNPESEYLLEISKNLRSYEDVCKYLPNQAYIGNLTPSELEEYAQPWVNTPSTFESTTGKFGQIMSEEELYLVIQACDVFEIMFLEETFVTMAKKKLAQNVIMTDDFMARVKDGVPQSEIDKKTNEEHGEGLYFNGALVGVVVRGHDVDTNLSAHILHENLVSKATGVISLMHLVKNSGMDASEIDYVIDCSEEACGDMNQRGGGNFAKAAAEIAGLQNATGSDVRGFCAAPTHALIVAASLVKAGTFKNVAITAGGSTAKLGMNGKDHIKKGFPVMEDVLGGFAILVSQNDGVHAEINLDVVGRHTVGTGSSPQAVITSLVAKPLEDNGMKITDIDKYSAEMQNPDLTMPAGAGNVPLANFKMIGALAVKRGELEKAQLMQFTKDHGMCGWAPTQGHIPSGVPYVGFAAEALENKEIARVMIIGKGSLFLGRMTNLFDGVSVMLQQNTAIEEKAKQEQGKVSEDAIRKMIASAMREFALNLDGKE